MSSARIGPASSSPTSYSAMSSPCPTRMRSSSTSVISGCCTAKPSNRPAASADVMTDVAPLWRRRWTFSSSRTAATIVAVGLSSRAVSVTSTAVSSRLTATMIERASAIPAWRSTAVDAAVPQITVRPVAFACSRASGESSMTTTSLAPDPLVEQGRRALAP